MGSVSPPDLRSSCGGCGDAQTRKGGFQDCESRHRRRSRRGGEHWSCREWHDVCVAVQANSYCFAPLSKGRRRPQCEVQKVWGWPWHARPPPSPVQCGTTVDGIIACDHEGSRITYCNTRPKFCDYNYLDGNSDCITIDSDLKASSTSYQQLTAATSRQLDPIDEPLRSPS